jgi:hypothetical protein
MTPMTNNGDALKALEPLLGEWRRRGRHELLRNVPAQRCRGPRANVLQNPVAIRIRWLIV